MKIALIGASRSGKTTYFGGVFLRFRNVISSPKLSSALKEKLLRKGIKEKVGFRIRIDDPVLEKALSIHAEKLSAVPMEFPNSTAFIDERTIHISIDFVPLDGKNSVRSYERTVKIFDPAGEAMRGGADSPEEILSQLEDCDVGMIFLPLDILLKAIDLETKTVDENRMAVIMTQFALGKSIETLTAINQRLAQDEVFPLCFVISKADDVPSDKVEFVYQVVYDHIIERFSMDNKRHLICVCPVSVVNQKDKCFQATNLEWPFLFAVGGSILHEGYKLKRTANAERDSAGNYEQNADRLENLANDGIIGFISYLFTDGNYAEEREKASKYRSYAAESEKRASENIKLARDIWQSIDTEGFENQVRIIANGKLIKAADYV